VQVSARLGQRLDVLLLDGQQRQTLTCSRLYGRRGLQVGVAACDSDSPRALALRSRWPRLRAILPDVSRDSEGFVDALLQVLADYPADVVLPGHDGSIEAIRARREEVERVSALPVASEAALDIAVDKECTLALARELGIPTPRCVVVRSDSEIESAIRDVGLPVVVKPTRSWVAQGGGGTRLTSMAVISVDQARRAWKYIAGCGGEAEIQQWLPGRREAISCFMAQGEIWAQFAQISYREFPVLGGVSVLCESIPAPEDTGRFAELLVRAIGLEGCSMVEFRRDADGRPALMEVNPRMGGSVALAARCGVDFPGLTYSWAMGRPLSRTEGYAIGRRLRWLSGDLWNLRASFESQGKPDVPSRASALTRFVVDFVARPGAIEPFDVTDPLPAWADIHANLLSPAARPLRRSLRALYRLLRRGDAS